MTRRRAHAHTVPTGKTDLPIKFHGEYAPALPVTRKGKSGRLLRRPQQDNPAATVADFCTADYRKLETNVKGRTTTLTQGGGEAEQVSAVIATSIFGETSEKAVAMG